MSAKVFNIGDQTISLQTGPRPYLEAPDQGPDWGFRIKLTFIFPK
jgi:hypothetical protein